MVPAFAVRKVDALYGKPILSGLWSAPFGMVSRNDAVDLVGKTRRFLNAQAVRARMCRESVPASTSKESRQDTDDSTDKTQKVRKIRRKASARRQSAPSARVAFANFQTRSNPAGSAEEPSFSECSSVIFVFRAQEIHRSVGRSCETTCRKPHGEAYGFRERR